MNRSVACRVTDACVIAISEDSPQLKSTLLTFFTNTESHVLFQTHLRPKALAVWVAFILSSHKPACCCSFPSLWSSSQSYRYSFISAPIFGCINDWVCAMQLYKLSSSCHMWTNVPPFWVFCCSCFWHLLALLRPQGLLRPPCCQPWPPSVKPSSLGCPELAGECQFSQVQYRGHTSHHLAHTDAKKTSLPHLQLCLQ